MRLALSKAFCEHLNVEVEISRQSARVFLFSQRGAARNFPESAKTPPNFTINHIEFRTASRGTRIFCADRITHFGRFYLGPIYEYFGATITHTHTHDAKTAKNCW